MDVVVETLTVLFENPFWIGIFEKVENGKLLVSKVTFGSEPRNFQVQEFILNNKYTLKYSVGIEEKASKQIKNPKRLQREIKKSTKNNTGIGTKSQQILKQQHELMKDERKTYVHDLKEYDKDKKFKLKQQKRKNKHKGH